MILLTAALKKTFSFFWIRDFQLQIDFLIFLLSENPLVPGTNNSWPWRGGRKWQDVKCPPSDPYHFQSIDVIFLFSNQVIITPPPRPAPRTDVIVFQLGSVF